MRHVCFDNNWTERLFLSHEKMHLKSCEGFGVNKICLCGPVNDLISFGIFSY